MSLARSSSTWTACSAFALLGLASSAYAGEQQARITIEVGITGNESASAGAGSDWSKSTISEHYRIVTTVRSDGVLNSVNAKDPEYGQKAMAQAAHDQARIRATQEKLAAAGVGPKPVTADAANALMQEMEAAVEKCGTDQACKQGVAMKYATRPDFAAAMAAMSSPEFVCRQQSGGDAARARQCLQAYGVSENAEPVELGEEEAAPDERYLMYIGWIGCPSEISAQIHNRVEGAYADVQGMVPYTNTTEADWHGTQTDQSSICVSYTTVLDTKADMLYTDGLAMPQVHGKSTNTEAQRAQPEQVFEGQISALPSAAANFVRDALLVRPLSGSKRGTVELDRPYLSRAPISEYSGKVDVEVSWKFERL
jgi:hypothetical protein